MAYQHKENSFSLFLNDKAGNPNRPDYTGTGLIDGKEVRVSLWKGVTQSGTERFSGQVTFIEKKSVMPEREPATEDPVTQPVEDTIPF